MTKEKWLIFALAALCLLPPVIILTCYVIYIKETPFTLNIKDISNSANDWSAFGSLMAGIFTFSGALATSLTLIIAVRQNKKLSEDALEKSRFDDRIASENREYMNNQKIKMNFEKYKIHLEVFHELLDRIERDSNGDNVFTSRNEIYKNLFPANSFDFCNTKTDESNYNPNGINDILNTIKSVEEKLKNKTYQKNFRIFIDDFLSLKSMMMIVTKREKRTGDITVNRKHIALNIYDIHNDIDFISMTVNSLSSFCGIATNHNITTYLSTERLLLSCNSFFSHQNNLNRISYIPPYELIQSNYIDAIIRFYRILNLSPSPINDMIKPATDYIWVSLSTLNISKLVTENGYRECLKFVHYILKRQKTQSIIMHPHEDINEAFSPYFYELDSMSNI